MLSRLALKVQPPLVDLDAFLSARLRTDFRCTLILLDTSGLQNMLVYPNDIGPTSFMPFAHIG